MANKKTTIAIIGAGASGTILANQLIDKISGNSSRGLSVFLIEKRHGMLPSLFEKIHVFASVNQHGPQSDPAETPKLS